jgi:hypothetical protein
MIAYLLKRSAFGFLGFKWRLTFVVLRAVFMIPLLISGESALSSFAEIGESGPFFFLYFGLTGILNFFAVMSLAWFMVLVGIFFPRCSHAWELAPAFGA